MKNALFIVLVFVILSVTITLVSSLGIFLIISSFSMIAGETLRFLGFSQFFHVLMLCLPFCFVLACLGLVFYFIRHPKISFLSTLIYFLLGFCVWLFLIPVVLPVFSTESTAETKAEGNCLSKGFFRSTEHSIDYITAFLSEGSAEGVRITEEKGIEKVLFDKGHLGNIENTFCIDPLFAQTIHLTPILKVLQDFFSFAQAEITYSLQRGYLYYLMFSSLGLALLSIFFVKRLSAWKLINVSIVVTIFVLICRINRSLFSAKGFESILTFFRHNRAFWIANPYNFQFVMNISISFVLGLIGLISHLMYRKKMKSVLE